MDGDGKPDTAWSALDGSFGVTTASGATAGVTPGTLSPSGAAPTAFFGDVTGDGEVVMFVSDSRVANLYRFLDCTIQPVLDPQGRQYRFDRTGQYGSGAACEIVDGAPQLVGLKLEQSAGAFRPGSTATVDRTVILLEGTQATAGPTDTVTFTAESDVDAAASLTCGDQGISGNGVTQER